MIKVFTMEVYDILDDYPEKKERQRKWFSIELAMRVIVIPEISQMIKELDSRLRVV